jgi:transposase
MCLDGILCKDIAEKYSMDLRSIWRYLSKFDDCAEQMHKNKTNHSVGDKNPMYGRSRSDRVKKLISEGHYILNEEQRKDCCKMYSDGIDVGVIAKKYGIKRATAFDYIKHLPRHKRRSPKRDIVYKNIDDILSMINDGISMRKIGKRYGMDGKVVKAGIKKYKEEKLNKN